MFGGYGYDAARNTMEHDKNNNQAQGTGKGKAQVLGADKGKAIGPDENKGKVIRTGQGKGRGVLPVRDMPATRGPQPPTTPPPVAPYIDTLVTDKQSLNKIKAQLKVRDLKKQRALDDFQNAIDNITAMTMRELAGADKAFRDFFQETTHPSVMSMSEEFHLQRHYEDELDEIMNEQFNVQQMDMIMSQAIDPARDRTIDEHMRQILVEAARETD